MKDSLQQTSQYAMDGLREFSEHPIKYSSRALKEFVTDYWDLGLAIASGLAWTPYGKDIYNPELQPYVAGLGPIVSMAAGGWMHLKEAEKAGDRVTRNGLSFLATLGFGNSSLSSGKLDLLSVANGAVGVVSTSAASFMEIMRRTKSNTNSTKIATLENQIS